MKHIIKNDLGIKKEEIDQEVTRIKVLLINKKNELLLGYGNNCYQFIGGHLENNEDLMACLRREVKEEVGITLENIEIKPFLLLEHYCHDHPEVEEKINCKIYYFSLYTNQLPNLCYTNYTEEEIKGNFTYQYIPLDTVEEKIINNYQKYPHAKIVGEEMLYTLKIFKEKRGK